jgi:hypothetical protein
VTTDVLNPTWDYAAEQVVHAMDTFTSPGPAQLDMLRFYSEQLARLVRDEPEHLYTSMLFYGIGCEALGELKDMGLWDADAFVQLLVSKQSDYGHDNINAFGHVGVAVRLCDKIARFFNLTTRAHEAANEPLVDTLRDMVGYAVIAEMLTCGTFQLRLAATA